MTKSISHSAPPQNVVEGVARPDQSKIGMLLLDFANGFECDDVDFARTTGAILINSAAEAARTPPDPLDNLVARFSVALLEKLKAAREKYGFSREHWRDTDWMESCQRSLVEHLAKGDPRDVAAYCAFMWHHGWKTAAHPAESAIRADERERCARIADLAGFQHGDNASRAAMADKIAAAIRAWRGEG